MFSISRTSLFLYKKKNYKWRKPIYGLLYLLHKEMRRKTVIDFDSSYNHLKIEIIWLFLEWKCINYENNAAMLYRTCRWK